MHGVLIARASTSRIFVVVVVLLFSGICFFVFQHRPRYYLQHLLHRRCRRRCRLCRRRRHGHCCCRRRRLSSLSSFVFRLSSFVFRHRLCRLSSLSSFVFRLSSFVVVVIVVVVFRRRRRHHHRIQTSNNGERRATSINHSFGGTFLNFGSTYSVFQHFDICENFNAWTPWKTVIVIPAKLCTKVLVPMLKRKVGGRLSKIRRAKRCIVASLHHQNKKSRQLLLLWSCGAPPLHAGRSTPRLRWWLAR